MLFSYDSHIVEDWSLTLPRSPCVLRPMSKVLTQFPFVHRHLYLPVLILAGLERFSGSTSAEASVSATILLFCDCEVTRRPLLKSK